MRKKCIVVVFNAIPRGGEKRWGKVVIQEEEKKKAKSFGISGGERKSVLSRFEGGEDG